MRSNILFDFLVAIVTLISTINATPASVSPGSSSIVSSANGQSVLKVQTPDGVRIDTPQHEQGSNLTVNYLNNLVPPYGTCWFKQLVAPMTGTNNKVAWDMHIDVYVYATGANPRDPVNFQKNGGMFYVIAVLRGTISVSSSSIFLSTLMVDISPMTIVTALPTNGSSSEGVHKYDIDFSQTRTMFKDGGVTPFDFTAEYRDTLTRTDTFQDFKMVQSYPMFRYGSNSAQVRQTDLFGFLALSLPYVETVELGIIVDAESRSTMPIQTVTIPIDLSFQDPGDCDPESRRG